MGSTSVPERVPTKATKGGAENSHKRPCRAGRCCWHSRIDQHHNEYWPGGSYMCPHTPLCHDASGRDREAARTFISQPKQGRSVLCNGIVIFANTEELRPDGER